MQTCVPQDHHLVATCYMICGLLHEVHLSTLDNQADCFAHALYSRNADRCDCERLSLQRLFFMQLMNPDSLGNMLDSPYAGASDWVPPPNREISLTRVHQNGTVHSQQQHSQVTPSSILDGLNAGKTCFFLKVAVMLLGIVHFVTGL
jgi:hypothetical protein